MFVVHRSADRLMIAASFPENILYIVTPSAQMIVIEGFTQSLLPLTVHVKVIGRGLELEAATVSPVSVGE